MLPVLVTAGGLAVLASLFALDAREHEAKARDRSVGAVLCAGSGCDIQARAE
jgi:hypothetical protein